MFSDLIKMTSEAEPLTNTGSPTIVVPHQNHGRHKTPDYNGYLLRPSMAEDGSHRDTDPELRIRENPLCFNVSTSPMRGSIAGSYHVIPRRSFVWLRTNRSRTSFERMLVVFVAVLFLTFTGLIAIVLISRHQCGFTQGKST